jgi:pimeloyl-ACP methyl ester carboxylesterase
VVPKGKGPFPAILFGHWGCGTRTEFLAEARLYARSKVVSLLVDYPWVRPSPWRGSLEYVANPEGDRELYVQAVIDLRRGIDLLESLPYVDRFRIAYIGHSYGAQWGAILSAVDKRLRAAVLIGGVGASADIWLDSDDPEFAELRKSVAKEQMDRFIEVMRVLDGIRYVPHANPVPLLFQFARYERYFGEASMQRYADAASEPKFVLWYGTGHEINDPKALSDRGDWLRRILRFRK